MFVGYDCFLSWLRTSETADARSIASKAIHQDAHAADSESRTRRMNGGIRFGSAPPKQRRKRLEPRWVLSRFMNNVVAVGKLRMAVAARLQSRGCAPPCTLARKTTLDAQWCSNRSSRPSVSEPTRNVAVRVTGAARFEVNARISGCALSPAKNES